MDAKYPWYIKFLFKLQHKKYGQVLNSAMIWARCPRIFLALSWLFNAVDHKKSTLAADLRTLIIVRVSQLNGCEFCIDLNSSVLIKRGVSMDKALALKDWSQSDLFSRHEKIVLEYAEAVTRSTQALAEEQRAKINQLFDEKQIVELTALIAFQNMSTKFNNAFAVEPQGFCSFK